MRTLICVAALVLPWAVIGSTLHSDDPSSSPELIKAAINKAIPRLEAGSKGSAEQRQCFTCHSQAVPILALSEVRKRGFSIDEENFERQLEHTAAYLEQGKDKYLAGKGQGGKVLTAGYALWTLEAGGRKPDEITAAVAHFLLEYQQDHTHWSHPGNRPPSSDSPFTASYVALRGLASFGTKEQQPQIEKRRKKLRDWLRVQTPRETEDHVFRLWALQFAGSDAKVIRRAAEDLIDCQGEDGGWAQTADMKSDPYATASVLAALLEPGETPADYDSIQQGLRYLLRTQLEDGSWHVTTRAKPFQTYYESGFPHGKDQFISIVATAWAVRALALTLPEPPTTEVSNE